MSIGRAEPSETGFSVTVTLCSNDNTYAEFIQRVAHNLKAIENEDLRRALDGSIWSYSQVVGQCVERACFSALPPEAGGSWAAGLAVRITAREEAKKVHP